LENEGMEALKRQHFSIQRASEYFDVRELQAQTGQQRDQFFAVLMKELCDNALDAAETAKVAPKLNIGVTFKGKSVRLYVSDNGAGIPPDIVEKVWDYNTRTSDKAAYRSPTRGAQGNALKTVLGIPYALSGKPSAILVEARGVRHIVKASMDPAGLPRVQSVRKEVPTRPGTRWQLTLPAAGLDIAPGRWGMAFALFNPHAFLKIRKTDESGGDQFACKAVAAKSRKFRKVAHAATVEVSKRWRKFMPTDFTSAWWYDQKAFAHLLFQKIAAWRAGAKDLPLREFVREFRGLREDAKAKAVCARLPQISRLSDFEKNIPGAGPEHLLKAMKSQCEPPSADILGCVGKEHFRRSFDRWYGLKKDGEKDRFWYKHAIVTVDDMPFVVEVAVADTERPGRFVSAMSFGFFLADRVPLPPFFLPIDRAGE
jgi:hypothetical protein